MKEEEIKKLPLSKRCFLYNSEKELPLLAGIPAKVIIEIKRLEQQKKELKEDNDHLYQSLNDRRKICDKLEAENKELIEENEKLLHILKMADTDIKVIGELSPQTYHIMRETIEQSK